MTLPASIKIGPINYAVSEEKDLHDVDGNYKKSWLNGIILNSSARVKVNAEMAYDVKVATLWHEVVHGILNNDGRTDDNEEHVIALGYGLMQVIRDNPELIRYTLGNQD